MVTHMHSPYLENAGQQERVPTPSSTLPLAAVALCQPEA